MGSAPTASAVAQSKSPKYTSTQVLALEKVLAVVAIGQFLGFKGALKGRRSGQRNFLFQRFPRWEKWCLRYPHPRRVPPHPKTRSTTPETGQNRRSNPSNKQLSNILWTSSVTYCEATTNTELCPSVCNENKIRGTFCHLDPCSSSETFLQSAKLSKPFCSASLASSDDGRRKKARWRNRAAHLDN